MDPTATPPVQSVVPPQQGVTSQQIQTTPVVPAAQPQPTPQPQPQAVTAPVGGKEHEAQPVTAVGPSQPEIIIPKEIQDAGVQVETATDQEIRLTPAQTAAGISASGPTIPPEPEYTMPLREEKVQSVLKKPNYMQSITWLATLIRRVLLQQKI